MNVEFNRHSHYTLLHVLPIDFRLVLGGKLRSFKLTQGSESRGNVPYEHTLDLLDDLFTDQVLG